MGIQVLFRVSFISRRFKMRKPHLFRQKVEKASVAHTRYMKGLDDEFHDKSD